MHWWYKLLRREGNVYYYAYSRESKNLDGEILYDDDNGEMQLLKPCSIDITEFAQKRARTHFWQIVDEGFPEERHICCG